MNNTETPKVPAEIQPNNFQEISSDEDDEDDDDIVVELKTLNNVTCSSEEKSSKEEHEEDEEDEEDDEPLNYPPKFTCTLCSTPKPIHDTFRVKGCHHFYCSSCVAEHVAKKIQESVTMVTCPDSGCAGFLEMESCKEILGREVYDRWGDLLCEEGVFGDERLNCPFEDCGALLINDGEVVRECECPYCWRLFCVQCKVPWHGDLDCLQFQMTRG